MLIVSSRTTCRVYSKTVFSLLKYIWGLFHSCFKSFTNFWSKLGFGTCKGILKLSPHWVYQRAQSRGQHSMIKRYGYIVISPVSTHPSSSIQKRMSHGFSAGDISLEAGHLYVNRDIFGGFCEANYLFECIWLFEGSGFIVDFPFRCAPVIRTLPL